MLELRLCESLRAVFAGTIAALLLALATLDAIAQPFPDHPLRLVVGFAPGGPADGLARIAAQALSEGLGQSVIVENRPGAGGMLAASAVAKSAPDGYTLLVNAVSDVINPLTNKQAQYSIETSFTPIALIASAPNVLVVHPSVPASSVAELIEYARAHPGELNYGSAGVGTVSHLAGAIVAATAHVQFVHVPYKGTAAAQADLITGRLQFMFDSMVSALANARAGKVKALAVTSPGRWPSAPELPALSESGFPGFDMTAWFGLVSPAGTPEPTIERISQALLKGLQSVDARRRIGALGAVPGRMTPAEFGRYIHTENARWKAIFSQGLVRIEE
jgi:tripartite-type tricarboxylate transporter receptor subunit TctC